MAAVDERLGVIIAPQRRPFAEMRSGYTAFSEGDVILAKITPCFENGKAAVARNLVNGIGFGSSEFHVLRSNGAVLPEYLLHFVRQDRFREMAINSMTGTAGQARLPAEYLRRLILPLPPLIEQRRIIEKVEALLAQVRAVRDRVVRVPLLLRRFRRGVLHAAFEGRLTEEWREATRQSNSARGDWTAALLSARAKLWEEHVASRLRRPRAYSQPPEAVPPEGVELPNGWGWGTVAHLALLDIGFAFKSSEYCNSGVRLLRGENIQPGSLRWSETRFWPEDRVGEFHHLLVEPGEIILALDRPLIAAGLKIARVRPEDVPALLVQRVMRFKMVDRRDTDFLYYYLLQKRFVDFLAHEGMTGSDLPHITGTGVAEFAVALPPQEERSEIVRRIEALFTLAHTIERRVKVAEAQAERLPQAILARAFAGQLVPTEAELARAEGRDYESASVLLERIRTEQEQRPSSRRRGREAAAREVAGS